MILKIKMSLRATEGSVAISQSEMKQSHKKRLRLPRRYAPRNDTIKLLLNY